MISDLLKSIIENSVKSPASTDFDCKQVFFNADADVEN